MIALKRRKLWSSSMIRLGSRRTDAVPRLPRGAAEDRVPEGEAREALLDELVVGRVEDAVVEGVERRRRRRLALEPGPAAVDGPEVARLRQLAVDGRELRVVGLVEVPDVHGVRRPRGLERQGRAGPDEERDGAGDPPLNLAVNYWWTGTAAAAIRHGVLTSRMHDPLRQTKSKAF